MSNIPTILAIVVVFLIGALVSSEWIWWRMNRERDDGCDGDDFGRAI